ncbi:MAG: T9SS type A sorting domain-containing protein [Ignavibacteria bacterium]|nr:T9SS type A sorting domain-containing protein [Ignavibacteria bacterium]
MGLNGIFFLDSNIGCAVSDVGTIFFTTNGGISWTSQPCGSPNTLNEVCFIHQGKGWTVGDNGTIVMYDNSTIPVELSSFTALVMSNAVSLTWSTATETNNQGFEVQRKSVNENNEWKQIDFVQGKGSTTELTNYSFEDKNLLPGRYLYRLKQLDFDGSFEYYELNSEVIIEAPNTFSLNQNYPNPFNPTTNISFNIPESGNVNLKVYNVLGNEVATLFNNELNAGNHNVIFNAIDFSSSVYYYRVEVEGKFIETKQMILLK